jgi:hypothetical protein
MQNIWLNEKSEHSPGTLFGRKAPALILFIQKIDGVLLFILIVALFLNGWNIWQDDAGLLRLFQSALSGQISWMLPFALFGVAARWFRARQGKVDEIRETLFWGTWLVPVACFFSVAGFFHHFLSISELKALVEEGKVKCFLLSGNNSGNSELVSWIEENGIEISSDEYSDSAADSSRQGMNGSPWGGNGQTLYKVE